MIYIVCSLYEILVKQYIYLILKSNFLFFCSMVDALRMSMNSTSIQPPNQLMQQSQDINKEGNGERVCNTKQVKRLGYL